MRAVRLLISTSVLLLLTTGCWVLDLFDFDKDEGDGCPPDVVGSVCTPIGPDGGHDDAGTMDDAGPDRACPYVGGSYGVSGCPATSCTVTQSMTDCFADVTCETSAGTLMSATFIEMDGTFMVAAGPGHCDLQAQADGRITGTCTDIIGVSSCMFVGTPL